MPESRFRTRELPLSGRLRTADDPTTIGPNDLAVCKNIRPWDQYPRGIGGMTKVNTVALVSTNIKNGIHFRKAQPSESHVLAWTSDGNVWINDTPIPNQGDFAGAALFTDTVPGPTGRFTVTPGGGLVYCNGVDTIFWGGDEYRCAGFVDIPNATDTYDYSTVIDNTKSDAANIATIHTDGGGTPVATFYVGSIMPVDGFKLYIITPNNAPAAMEVYYHDGTDFSNAVGSLVDNTSSAGYSLVNTGTVTFYSTKDIAKVSAINGTFLYWYKVVVTGSGADFSGVPKIYHATVSIPAQQIKDIQDGELRPCDSFLLIRSGGRVYDFTANVATSNFDSNDAGTYAQINHLDTNADSWLLVGFTEPMTGFAIVMGDTYVETATCAMTVKYWDGADWVAVSGLVDGTSSGTISMARSGIVTWTPPSANTEQRYVQPFAIHSKDNVYRNLYYYQISFNISISTDDRFDLFQGIAAPKTVRGYSFPTVFQNRVALLDNKDGARNSILLSAQESDNVFNGLDSYEWFLGKNEPLVSSASLFMRFGSTVQDMLIVCKQGETWIVEGTGSDSDPYRQRLFSEKIGCVAPLTMVTIPTGEEISQGVRRSFAVWQSQRGIELFEGNALMLISDDIRDLFDPRSPTYTASSSCAAFYDPVYDEYHWVTGTQEWVFSFKYKKWYQIVRGTNRYLYGGIPVMDSSGNSSVYGFNNIGYLYQLENGTDFDGNSIVHTLKTGAIALNENKISEETTLRMVKVVQVAKNITANSMIITHFGDTDTVGNVIGTFSPAKAGKRLCSRIVNAQSKGPHVHHEFQLYLYTHDEVYGCEPIYIVAYYDGERQDVR